MCRHCPVIASGIERFCNKCSKRRLLKIRAETGKDSGHLGGDSGHLGERPQDDMVLCTLCKKSLPVTAFDPVKLSRWQTNRHVTQKATCLECDTNDKVLCTLCTKSLPVTAFDPLKLSKWRTNRDVPKKAICLECDKADKVLCTVCTKSLPVTAFDQDRLTM